MYYIDDGRYGSFSDIPDTDFRVAPIEKLTSKLTYPSCICGHFLAGLDIVKEDCQLPKLSIGDWLYFDCFGAYTSTMLCNFNGFGNVKCTYYYATSKVWTSIQLNASQDFNASITFLE
ncbi:ornithine decarboxylase-like [Exaiptasia diaphana]|uniref:Orn/DAP/Arg decarboxylase 2 C-terminal domain-containing protein n=1 Tax=Exaiptasia diaphana TaxID=2652724 RepID=A0A913WZL6_EXADI|nr:ornithine decarboxylase-like [Exaiptasia diaphana]